MNFITKAFTVMAGVGLAGIGALCIYTVFGFERSSTFDWGLLFLLLPMAGMLAISGIYVIYRGVTAEPPYISPTGTGETSTKK